MRQDLDSTPNPQKNSPQHKRFPNHNLRRLMFYTAAGSTFCLCASEVVWGLYSSNTAMIISGTAGLATSLPALALVATSVKE